MAVSTPAPSRLRSCLRATAMLVGAGLLFWRTGTTWAAVLTFVTGGLLALALVMPRAYAPLSHAMDRAQAFLLRAFSWVLLAVVFGLIFVPGRLILCLRGGGRFSRHEKTDTFWKPAKPLVATSFDRQY